MKFKIMLLCFFALLVIGCSSPTDREITTASASMPTTTLHKIAISAIHFGETFVPLENPSWSHDGTMIAFSQGNEDISIVNPETWQDVQTICETPHYTDLVWSPDDSRIAYNSSPLCLAGEGCISKILIQQCNVKTGEISFFPNLPEKVSNVLDWYGNKILLLSDSFLIYDTESQTTISLDLPFTNKQMYRTAYFADEAHILYMGNEIEPDTYNGTGRVNPTVYIANIVTGEIQEIVNAGQVSINTPSYSASISPNGRWTGWLWVEKLGNETIKTFNLLDLNSGEKFVALQGDDAPHSSPSWAPDSKQLVFITDREIKVLELDAP